MNYLKIIFIYNIKDSPNKKVCGERRIYGNKIIIPYSHDISV